MLDEIGDHHGAKKSHVRVVCKATIAPSCDFSLLPRVFMERTPDERREILRRFMIDRSLKVSRWAKASGVAPNSLYNFLNGYVPGMDPRTYAKLARTAEVPVWKLTGDEPELPSPTAIWVVSDVQAGYFKEAVEWDQTQWRAIDVPVPSRFRGVARGSEIRGSSMNMVYPEGSVAVWVPTMHIREPKHGDRVIVYRWLTDDTVEATCKEYRVVNGEVWFWPRSTDPLFQTPIRYKEPGDDVKTIEIAGIVIGSYQSEFE